MMLKFLGSVRVSPHFRIVNIQERRFIAEKGLHLRAADIGVCLNLQVDESLPNNCVTSKACTLILYRYMHPFRGLFVITPLDTKFRSYVCLLHLPVNNSEQYNVFNCFLTVMPVCLFKKTARQQRTIIEPYPSPASSDALLGFVFGVLSSSWVRNLCSMCVCV